tara:strand:- start:562 stop:702 length:141 start_codon:yes stop_codon:yes gene_type:complete
MKTVTFFLIGLLMILNSHVVHGQTNDIFPNLVFAEEEQAEEEPDCE